MSMLVIEGRYRIIKNFPDGDSCRFYPTNPADWQLVPGPHPVLANGSGGAQLRMDGIDALETHYPSHVVGFGVVRQPREFGRQAASELLKWLGFSEVERRADEMVTASTPDEVAGWILTRTADKYGRCVSFLFKGQPPVDSGRSLHFDIAELHASANYHLLAGGLVYPTYYTKLYHDIRGEMTAAVKRARPNAGLWPSDKSTAGFDLQNVQTLFEDVVLLPKLFRRLVDYLALNNGDPSLVGFASYLATLDDRLFILSSGHYTGFDYVVDVQGQRVRLTHLPEDLVFMEA